MNYIDLAAFAIIGGFALFGLSKGLVKSVFQLFSSILALILSYLVYPPAVKLMHEMGVLEIMSGWIIKVLNLSDMGNAAAAKTADIVSSLHLPDLMKTALIEGNNFEMYAKFGVDSAVAYIGTFIANLLLNTLTMLLVFVVIRIFLYYAAIALDLIARLPVIRTFNKIGGTAFGLAQGLIAAWLLFSLLLAVCPMSSSLSGMIDGSLTRSLFYEGNIFINKMLKAIL